MSSRKRYLICIIGPTAVGKTSLSLRIASWLGAEVLSADSRQFYRELKIGTAKPSEHELSQIPHHLIDSLSIHDEYDVGLFEKESLKIIKELHLKDQFVVMVGGSGLFVNAVCEGLDEFPEVKEGMRDQLNVEFQKDGLEKLVQELLKADPEYAQIVDLKNPQRIIRALEVIRSTGHKFSSFRKSQKKPRPFEVIKIGLEMDREILYQRIDQRMDEMIEQGLFEEAKNLLPFKHLNALQTVGYQEIFPFLEGIYDYVEAVRLLKRNSRRYAKRQLTWFKKDSSVRWFNPNKAEEIIRYLSESLEFPEAKN